jgi:hypothetical protein
MTATRPTTGRPARQPLLLDPPGAVAGDRHGGQCRHVVGGGGHARGAGRIFHRPGRGLAALYADDDRLRAGQSVDRPGGGPPRRQLRAGGGGTPVGGWATSPRRPAPRSWSWRWRNSSSGWGRPPSSARSSPTSRSGFGAGAASPSPSPPAAIIWPARSGRWRWRACWRARAGGRSTWCWRSWSRARSCRWRNFSAAACPRSASAPTAQASPFVPRQVPMEPARADVDPRLRRGRLLRGDVDAAGPYRRALRRSSASAPPWGPRCCR